MSLYSSIDKAYPPVAVTADIRGLTIGSVSTVLAVVALDVDEEMSDVGGAGVVYGLVLHGLDPQIIGGESVRTVIALVTLVAFVAFFTLVTFISLFSFFTFFAGVAASLDTGVLGTDEPVAVLSDVRNESVSAVVARQEEIEIRD